jgi:type II secretory pathway pseudopilin PulG
MAALLVVIAVMAVMLSVAMPTWRHMVQREKEEELVFRGQQYVRAIALFQRRYAASFPPSVDILVSQRFLRKKYKDPMTPDGEFQVLYQMSPPGQQMRQGETRRTAGGGVSRGVQGGPETPFGTGTLGPRGGIIGVASKSTEKSIRLYNGREHYNEWQFVFVPRMLPGQGAGRPGTRGERGAGPGGRGGFGPGGRGGGFGQGPAGFERPGTGGPTGGRGTGPGQRDPG